MLIRTATGVEQVIDYRETAPGTSDPDYFDKNAEVMGMGAKSVAVPGQVAGLAMAHELHGKLPWASLFQPAIDIAT